MFNWFYTMNSVSAIEIAEVAIPTAESNAMTALPLISKGLLTTAVGLLGVFLVLTLFFMTIKIMQGIKTKDEEN